MDTDETTNSGAEIDDQVEEQQPKPKPKQKRAMSEEAKQKARETLAKARAIKLTKYPKGTKRDSAVKKKISMEEESINTLAEIKAKEILEKKRIEEELAEYRALKAKLAQDDAPPKKKKAPTKKTPAKPKTAPKKKVVVQEESSDDEQQQPEVYYQNRSMFDINDFLD
jgi:hypothetical protein